MPEGTALVVEDEDSIAALVRSYLERDGFTVVRARSGADALGELERLPVRVVVLDVGLPDLDGFDVCRRIRAGSRVPILMLTARDEEPDRITGLELGADDYLTKPFSPRELVARMKAVLRRTDGRSAEDVLTLADVVLDRRRAVPLAPESVRGPLHVRPLAPAARILTAWQERPRPFSWSRTRRRSPRSSRST